MPDERPAADPPESGDTGSRSSGKLVVILIVLWTAVLLTAGTIAVRKLQSDPCWDRGPGHAPPPPECVPKPK